MKKILFNLFIPIFCIGFTFSAFGEIPATYYKDAVGKKDKALKTALSGILSNSGTISYNGLWTAYGTTDTKNNKILDMYSSISSFVYKNDQCGSYSVEGDCYNREHSVPKSWFNDATPMYSDIWHLYPTDGKINGMRSNFPFGEVGNISSQSSGGFSKLGSCKTPGFSGTVFEPNDEYKGDFARAYFYMATRYESRISNWGGIFISTYPNIVKWQLDMLIRWAKMDPVSDKEIQRNEAVYKTAQRNRNPFIDYPVLVDLIFGDRQGDVFDPNGSGVEQEELAPKIRIFTLDNRILVENAPANATVQVFGITGCLVITRTLHEASEEFGSLASGTYIVRVLTNGHSFAEKVIIP